MWLLKIWRRGSEENCVFTNIAAIHNAGAKAKKNQEIKDQERAPQDEGHIFKDERNY